ncbi:hypothetical protein PAMP_008139 [Pampus punctatissimus]
MMGNLPTEHFQDDSTQFTATVYSTYTILTVDSGYWRSQTNYKPVLTQRTLSPVGRLQGVKERGCDTPIWPCSSAN